MTPPITRTEPAQSESTTALEPASSGTESAPPPEPSESTTGNRRPFILDGRLSVGVSEHGGINGTLFDINPIGDFGEFTYFEGAASLLFNLLDGNPVQLRVGPRLSGAVNIGDENSGGSSLYSIRIGPRFEVDWRAAYGNSVIAGPSRIGIDLSVGYGAGTTTAETFSLHSQEGVDLSVGADVNLVNVSFGGIEVGLDFFFRTGMIAGSSFNTPFNTIGGLLAFRTAEEAPVAGDLCTEEEQTDYTAQIQEFQEANAALREENAELAQLVAAIRTRLEAREITREDMVEELRAGFVDYLANREENPITDEAEATRLAEERFPDDFDPFLWQEVDPREIPDPLPEDCEALRNIERGLRDENAELRENRGLLTGLARMGFIRLGVPENVAESYTSAVARLRDVTFRTNTPFGQRAEESAARHEGGYNADADISSIDAAATAWASGHAIDPATGLREAAPSAELERVFGPLFPPGEGRDGASHFHSIEILHELATALRDPSMRNMLIFLVGHTSSPGSDAHNLALSRRRARAIRDFLIMEGLPETRLFYDGRGETELLYQRDVIGGNEPAHRMNAEFPTLRNYGIRTATQQREEALRRQGTNRRMEITIGYANSTDPAIQALMADPDIAAQLREAGIIAPGASIAPAGGPETDDSGAGGGEASATGGEEPPIRHRHRDPVDPPPPPPPPPPPARNPEAGE